MEQQEDEYRPINHPHLVNSTFIISNRGTIINTKTGNIRSPAFNGRIELDRMLISVGRLVALTFLTEPGIDYTKKRVRHLDKNKSNNRVENLQWY